jgi:phospholipase/carboxylesterase
MGELLPRVEVETGPAPRASVIWLHGLGADGHDFEPIVPALALPFAVRYLFPHAPVRPVSLNGGWPMRAWFDLGAIDPAAELDRAGIDESTAAVAALIAHEVARGVPVERIVLAGFSQGGSIALHAGLRQRQPLAGIIALSTFLPAAETLPTEASEANHATPILMAHGTLDAVVPEAFGAASRDVLLEFGHPVEWRSYPIAHSVCDPEVAAIRSFLGRVLA